MTATTLREDRPPLPSRRAVPALARCLATTLALCARRTLRQPREHVGSLLGFGDGTRAPVYRETVVTTAARHAPAVLVVAFRLRWVRGRGHALFRAESVLNTPLFAGFPGFVSKLWLAHDGNGVYRGFYQWNDAALAEDYARSLWWVLALVSTRASIRYVVVPGVGRDEVLADPALLDTLAPDRRDEWWRLTALARPDP